VIRKLSNSDKAWAYIRIVTAICIWCRFIWDAVYKIP